MMAKFTGTTYGTFQNLVEMSCVAFFINLQRNYGHYKLLILLFAFVRSVVHYQSFKKLKRG